MVQTSATGEVGFILPRRAAAHYRNLYYYSQALEQQVDSLTLAFGTSEERVRVRGEEIRLLEGQKAALQAKNASYEGDLLALRETLALTNEARKRERRWKIFWRTTSIVLAGSTAALVVAR